MSKPILIIGAGVSGLSFAQGYRFRISDDGVRGLEQNLTSERFEDFKRRSCSVMSVVNARPSVLYPETAEPARLPPHLEGRSRPQGTSVDRTALRSVLLEGIDKHVHFGKAFESYYETNGGVTVTFTDKSEVTGVALVGSDGTWSKVRQQLLPEQRLVDTQGRLIFGKTDISDELLSGFLPQCANGPSMFLGRERKFLAEPMYFDKQAHQAPADYVYWVLFGRSDEDILSRDFDTLSADETVALANKMTQDWHPSLRCLIEKANKGQTAMFPILSTRPAVQMPENANSRVTLLGDAIHPMSPTAALGATTALRDASVLVHVLAQNDLENITSSFRTYEREMCAYASEAVKSSAEGGKMFFGMRPFDELSIIR
ncbi:hypothetical protein MBLNU459_g6877t1 [Dothideomycetes sp. NU459]